MLVNLHSNTTADDVTEWNVMRSMKYGGQWW